MARPVTVTVAQDEQAGTWYVSFNGRTVASGDLDSLLAVFHLSTSMIEQEMEANPRLDRRR